MSSIHSQTTTVAVNKLQVINGTLLVAGTTIGGGMLAIPYVTGKAGFLPGIMITFIVWGFMFCTGVLLLEATLKMPRGSNILSISSHYLGKKGKILASLTFVFLYYCLMTAYFAGGSPIFASFITDITGVVLRPISALAIFGVVFGSIVWMGLQLVDRVNYILMLGLILTFVFMFVGGSSYVKPQRLLSSNWSTMVFAAPILFSSFGYHNIIPSLTDYYNRNEKTLYYVILFGTLLPLVVYVIWQFLILGMIPNRDFLSADQSNMWIISQIQVITGNSWIYFIGRSFWFFAIITSFLGVSISVMDFLKDAFKWKNNLSNRFSLSLLVFLPPMIFAMFNPSVFVGALELAGGFGEAFINGILPIWMVFAALQKKDFKISFPFFCERKVLFVLLLMGSAVMVLESYLVAFN